MIWPQVVYLLSFRMTRNERKIKNEKKTLASESHVINKIAKPIKKNKKAKSSTCDCC